MINKIIKRVVFIGVLISNTALASITIPQKALMLDAVDIAISQAKKSNFKEIRVTTKGISFSGEFVQKADNIITLKVKSGRKNLKTKKERVSYHFIETKEIQAISFDVYE